MTNDNFNDITLKLFAERVKKPPAEDVRYIFVTDSKKLIENIIASETESFGMFISNDSDIEQFKEIVGEMVLNGSYIRKFHISPVGSIKKLNEKISEVLNYWEIPTDNNAWKLFNNKDKCFNFYEENFEAVKEVLKNYIEKQTPKPSGNKVNIKQFEIIEEKSTAWLWYPYIPRGKVTILSGVQGTGKTFFTCWIAAQVSTGGNFGDDNPFDSAPENVLMFNAEDSIADTLKPRLKPLQPDFKRIMTVEEWGDPNFIQYTFGDLERLTAVFEEVEPALVIFDPVQAYLGAGTDMHRANEVRPLMANLSALAERYNTAVLLVGHLNKSTTQSVFDRVLGSVDFMAAVRSGLFLGQHPDEKQTKILFQIKSNLAEKGENLAYKIQNGVFIPHYKLDVSEITPEQAAEIRRPEKTRDKPNVSLNKAIDFLKDLLGGKGYEKIEVIKAKADEMGIKERTLYNAKKELSINSKNIGFGKSKISWWSMPDIELPKEPEQIKLQSP